MLQQYKISYKNIQEFDQKYERVKNLGSGTYGTVDLLKKLQVDQNDIQNDIEYCVKKFKNNVILDEQENEVISYYTLKLLQPQYSQFVLNVQECYLDEIKQQISMVMPKAVHSFTDEIADRIKTKNFFKPKDLTYLLSCALLGQLSIETIGMVHRDIKLDNFLIMKNDSLVITDLGTSKRVSSHNFIQNSILVGTYGYWSPEQIYNLQKYKEADYFEYSSSLQAQQELKLNDLYGIGLCFVQAATLSYLPRCKKGKQQEYCEERQEWLNVAFSQLEFQELYSKDFIKLLKNMLENNPQKRYNLVQALQSLENIKDW